MSEDGNSEKGNVETNSLKFKVRLNKRVPVQTSLGTLYARQLSIRDLSSFNSYLDPRANKATTDLRALGEFAIRTLVTAHSETDCTPALTHDVYAKLDVEDLQKLATGVAEASKLDNFQCGDALDVLGSAIFDRLAEQRERAAESSMQMKKMLDKQFGAVSDDVRKSLESSLNSLTSLRDSLHLSTAVEGCRKVTEDQEALRRTPFIGELDANQERQHQHLSARIPAIDFENSPMGRAAKATEDSAEQLREVSRITAQLADRVAEVSEVVMVKVLPEWFRNLSESTNASKTSLYHAERSLFWAKWALLGSILVTVGMTGWQIWVGSDYKLDNDKQQDRIERLLQEQLHESELLTQQLADQTKQLRGAIERLRPGAVSSRPGVNAKGTKNKKQR